MGLLETSIKLIIQKLFIWSFELIIIARSSEFVSSGSDLCKLTGSNENIFISVGKLGTISFFDIESFKDMKSLPDEMLSNLMALEELQILGCPNLRCVLDGIQNHEALKSLVIADCELLKIRCEKEEILLQSISLNG